MPSALRASDQAHMGGACAGRRDGRHIWFGFPLIHGVLLTALAARRKTN
jgi:hypothetical protein